ncbi:phosphate acetyltransferase [Shimia isoporae]|uniref:Phosphate acetyltransferase n=1 Tax=Shimia isoporae TaxID=647720 RepID=A0A4R1N432_9RHOB|nr:phosphate acyltransferase [Shimia isoporae]TCL01315.1 phosphate acetyltransferase [Shimia isoporae]
MKFMDALSAKVAAKNARVVFPESKEPRTAEAMRALDRDGLCRPVVLGENTESYVQALMDTRGMKEGIARRLVDKPLYRAAAMVAAGEADAMTAGAVAPTRRVIEAASMAIGLAEGVSVPSSFFLMNFPDDRSLIFADCGLTVDPDAAALAAIAKASARSGEALLGEARVALLSFSTGTSGAGASVDKVREAAQISGFTGPVQGDAALIPEVAERKGAGAGDANVLIFPNLDAGNIAYKLAVALGGAQALGPILQGFRKPVCDLSRGASAQDIVAATVVTLALG